jgi:hypothetical protein
MATVLKILLNIKGDAKADNFYYFPTMTNNKILDRQLYIPYEIELVKDNLIKASDISNNINDNNLLNIFTKPELLFKAIDYAKLDTNKDTSKTLVESYEKRILQENIDLLLSLTLKKKKDIYLKGDTYRIYETNIENIKINEKSSVQVESVVVTVNITVLKSDSKKQKLSCKVKREKLRESIKTVFKYDLLGPSKKDKNIATRLSVPKIPLKVPNKTRRYRDRYRFRDNYDSRDDSRHYLRRRNNFRNRRNYLGGKKITKTKKCLTKTKKCLTKTKKCLTRINKNKNTSQTKNKKYSRKI